MLGVVLLAAWFASGGYDHLTAPNHRWKLPNGDTIEVLTYDTYYEGSYSLTGKGISGARYLRLRFRSALQQPARDRSDVQAAVEILCPIANKQGLRELLIQPTRAWFFDLLRTSHNYHFRVQSAAQCDEVRGTG
ncbi:MAG TPA: hypothetical protein VH158_07170 [Gemmatimonadales bacterium]|jgi:hypothetical protein|nr:hypothetical protein [Gemmatimonadales bacterium]